MFSNLRFKHKILLLPSMSAMGFLLILLVALVVGNRNERLLTGVETENYPSLELNRDLEEALTTVHRQLDYGAAAGDTRALSQTDVLCETFLQQLDEYLPVGLAIHGSMAKEFTVVNILVGIQHGVVPVARLLYECLIDIHVVVLGQQHEIVLQE